jgi:predicted ATPase
MRLTAAHVKKFKSVDDSDIFAIDPGVTALVGKNESGKTAVLHAMYRMNPLSGGHIGDFQELRDYPRRYRARDQREIPEVEPISMTFALDEADVQEFEGQFGAGSLRAHEVTVSKKYGDNMCSWSAFYDTAAIIKQLVSNAGLDDQKFSGETIPALIAKLKADGESGPVALAVELESRIAKECCKLMANQLPRFQYFDEFSTLPGRVSIRTLQTASEGNLSAGDRTALALLRLAGVDTEEFTEENYEHRKAALEGAGNQLTDQLFEYWTQNPELSIALDVEFIRNASDPAQPPEPYLQVRVYNQRHRVTLNMDERSKGFIWFFSFLAAFSEYANDPTGRIVLLDEPGLGLHAMAQHDLLRFIDERLAPYHQVIYTTHSSFMIDPTKLERCRTVEDVDDKGTKVSSDIWSARSDTVFPLLGSLGIDMTESLIKGTDQLLVEGPSEVVYFTVMSDLARSRGKPALDPRWTLTPVGGLDKIPTFLALLNGGKVNMTVVFDVGAGGGQQLDNFIKRGLIDPVQFIPLTEITGTSRADVEDLFDRDWYLKLLNKSKVKRILPTDLSGSGRIVELVENYLGGPFDHFQPANYLLRKGDDLAAEISDACIERFSSLFVKLNALLS